MVGGVSYRTLEQRFGISKTALIRHRRNHLSPALVAVGRRRTERGARTIVERLESLLDDAETILDAAFEAKNSSQALAAMARMAPMLELMARITGELDERAQVTVNLQTTHEWVLIRELVVDFIPLERRPEFARRLKALEAPKVSAR